MTDDAVVCQWKTSHSGSSRWHVVERTTASRDTTLDTFVHNSTSHVPGSLRSVSSLYIPRWVCSLFSLVIYNMCYRRCFVIYLRVAMQTRQYCELRRSWCRWLVGRGSSCQCHTMLNGSRNVFLTHRFRQIFLVILFLLRLRVPTTTHSTTCSILKQPGSMTQLWPRHNSKRWLYELVWVRAGTVPVGVSVRSNRRRRVVSDRLCLTDLQSAY